MEYLVKSRSKRHRFEINKNDAPQQETTILLGKNSYTFKVLESASSGDARLISVNNKLLWIKIERSPDGFPNRIFINGTGYPVEIEKVEATRYRPPTPQRKASGQIKAPLPGQIAQILVETGQKVKLGQPVLVLEAMKMENEVSAPRDGIIKQINVSNRQLVSKGDILLEVGD